VFDFGERRTGIAFADTRTGTCSALGTVIARRGVPQWRAIDTLVGEWKPAVLVVGMPYNMDGSESAMTKRAARFASMLRERYTLPVETIDERLTSAEARLILGEQRRRGLRKKKTDKGDIDRLAAQLIGESWLSSL